MRDESECNYKRDVNWKWTETGIVYIIQKGAYLLSLTPMPGFDVAVEYIKSYYG